jgi:PAP_fibrillin
LKFFIQSFRHSPFFTMARPTMFHHVSCPVFLLAVVVVVVVLVWWNPVSEGFTIPHGFKNCRVFARNSDGVVGIPVAKVVMLSSSSSNEAEPGAKEEKNQDDSNAKTIDKLKKDLTSLAARTLRGFEATSKDRKAARAMIDELARFNPTREPAAAYYKNDYGRASTSTASSTPTLAGKWTLIYTDAPDITSLQQSITAELGRIGQECEPPYIRNVIEWKKPSWAANLPWSGTEKSSQESSARIIQKVVTEGSATPDRPTTVVSDNVIESDRFLQQHNSHFVVSFQ